MRYVSRDRGNPFKDGGNSERARPILKAYGATAADKIEHVRTRRLAGTWRVSRNQHQACGLFQAATRDEDGTLTQLSPDIWSVGGNTVRYDIPQDMYMLTQ